jgi:hypothetical protein
MTAEPEMVTWRVEMTNELIRMFDPDTTKAIEEAAKAVGKGDAPRAVG